MFSSHLRRTILSATLVLLTLALTISPTTSSAALSTRVARMHPNTLAPFGTLSDYDGMEFQGQLFFLARAVDASYDLWKSDGSIAGTVLVRDFPPFANQFDRAELITEFNGVLLFRAADEQGGLKTWRSDGTTVGTSPFVTHIASFAKVLVVGNTLFFYDSSLRKTDGTESGTVKVKDTNPNGSDFPYDQLIEPLLKAVGNTIYFSATDGVNGLELWKSDGTEAGTVMVKDIATGAAHSDPRLVGVSGTRMFFVVRSINPSTTYCLCKQLWLTDGTSDGTFMLADNISPGLSLYEVGGNLLFSAYTDEYQNELWRTDGTVAGTGIVKDINPGIDGNSGGQYGGSWPKNLTIFNGRLFFSVFDINDRAAFFPFNQTQSGIWTSDGTAAGTIKLTDRLWNEYGARDFNVVGDRLVFSRNDYFSISDGTVAGTIPLPGLTQYDNAGTILGLAGGQLFFTTVNRDDSSTIVSSDLWRTDGATTTRLQSLEAPYITSVLQTSTHLFFLARGLSESTYHLWSASFADLQSVRITLAPQSDSEVRSLDGQLIVTFPAGAVDGTVTVELRPLASPSQPTGTLQSVRSFTLEAVDNNGQSVTTFQEPYTITIDYGDSAVEGLYEPGLNLTFWDGQRWINVLPCTGCSVDTVNNRVTVQLDHFTEFALVGSTEYRNLLPLIQR